MPTVEEMLALVTKLPSEHYGLLWRPTVGEHDPTDYFREWPQPIPPIHTSELDIQVLRDALSLLKDPKLVVEIGVSAAEGVTTTSIILEWKPDTCTYIGIDTNSKAEFDNVGKKIYTLCNSSVEHDKLYALMELLDLREIDLMFVDGYHSINEVLWEWEYWERMAPNGVMVFHDSNYHPGPIAVLDAVDPELFDVTYYGRETPFFETDWGMAVVRRKIKE